MKADSVDKVVMQYFGAVTARQFIYKDVTYGVPRLTVSPLLLRGYTCPMGCGGCCPRFSLDYLPGEDQPRGTRPRTVRFNGYEVIIWSDTQEDHDSPRCRNLRQEDGRCGIHVRRPFSCDFELIRFMSRPGTAHMSQRLFSRGWNMKRTDGGQGAKCEMLPADPETVADVIRKLGRLTEWAQHFGIPTRVPRIIDWIESIKDDPMGADPLVLPARKVRTHVPSKDEH